MASAQTQLPSATTSFEAKAEQPALASMGASTLAESNISSNTLSPLLLSYRQLVGQLNWNDRQNGVTAKEAGAFIEPSSPVVFPTDRPAAMALPGVAATLGHLAMLGTIMGMAAMLHSEASDRSTRPLSWGTAAIELSVQRATEALKLKGRLRPCRVSTLPALTTTL